MPAVKKEVRSRLCPLSSSSNGAACAAWATARSRPPALVFILAMTVLLAGMFFNLSCAPRQAAVEVETEGALLIPSQEEEIRLRAYHPEVELVLTWEDEDSGSAAVVVENIAADSIEVKVTPVAGQDAAL